MATPVGPVVYVTDLEGRWEKLGEALEGCTWVRLEGDRLWLHPDALFVYGGDTVDRGPAGHLLPHVVACRWKPGSPPR